MSENAKLDPATLSATVREMYPPPTPLVGWLGFYYDSSKDAPEDAGWYCSGKVHPDREEALCELAGFRPFEGSALVEVGQASALFAPATEKAVCPNCKRDDTGHSWKVNGELRYSCNGWNKPAQPEPAAPVTGSTPISEYDPDMKPAAPEMPEAVRDVLQYLRFTSGTVANDRADALESWWRTHSQPVDDEDLQFHINRAEYWIKERVLLGDQKETVFALKVAACKKQPVAVAVGMTEELRMILDVAESRAEDQRHDGLLECSRNLERAIAAVRQQAAQGRKVELGKVRELVNDLKRALSEAAPSEMTMLDPHEWRSDLDAVFAELDAAEGKRRE